jgi:hypothetical protein
MFLLFLVVCGVIALVVVKVIKPNQKKIQDAASVVPLPNITNALDTASSAVTDTFKQVTAPSGRRLLQRMIFEGLQVVDACC